jgi:predicted GNAT family acetyltransferase
VPILVCACSPKVDDEPRRVPYRLTKFLARPCRHGRLTECYDDSGGGSGAGRAAAVTYVVVEPSIRGKGFGRILMHQLELEARRLNYHYLYLWTQTAIGFYEALGYVACHRVSLHRDCLKSLAPEQVSNLESALSKRFGAKNAVSRDEGSAAGTDRRSETILLPPEDGCSSQDVWMRKRLVEKLDPVPVPTETRVEEMRQYVREREAATGVPLAWEYFLVPLPLAYHPQVGPSCGLAAIRVVRDRYKSSSEAYDSGNMSLLQLAQNLGMTADGELFDADDLGCLIQRVCRLDNVLVQSFPSIDEITSILVERNGLIVLPYDSHPGTRLPFLNSGRSAHWGVVVGVLHGLPKEGSTEFDTEPTLTPLNGRNVDLSEVAETILLMQHGLSRKLAIAPYEDIRSSNAQLSAVDSRKFHVRNLNLLDRVVIVGPNSE